MSRLSVPSAFQPAAPRTFEEAGLTAPLVTDLVVKRLYIDGVSSLFQLCDALKLPHRIIESVFQHLKQHQFVDVKGIVGEDYSFSLTNAGQRLAVARRRICEYAGPAPVSIRDYHTAVRQQSAKVSVSRQALAAVFSDLVIPEKLIGQLGPALVSQKALFLYGPTGNGKTSLAERLPRVFQDSVLIPYAVEVDSQIIVVYDPVVHERVADVGAELDPRWVPCRRPLVIAGGELTPQMLELRLDNASQIYAAPLQMKANNGVLVIDDFGRQMISPRKLLNRWILPLDRRVDYLTLRYGVKFDIPFELMVVFSTNLDPYDLADEAFLRRIHNKIFVEPVSAETFDEIFDRVVAQKALPCENGSAEYLRRLCAAAGSTELRACYPADICGIIASIKEFEGEPLAISRSDLERATSLYFARRRETDAAETRPLTAPARDSGLNFAN